MEFILRRHSWKSLIERYAFSLLTCFLALFFTRRISAVSQGHFFEFFEAAVVLSAWHGGTGPGIFAAVTSFFMIDYYLIMPLNAFVFNPQEEWRFIVFGTVAVLTGSLSGKLKWAKLELERHVEELKKAKFDLEKAHDELEIRIQQRTDQLSQSNKRLMYEISQRMEAEKAIMEISNREQRRLGQDLHDGLSQMLAGVKLMAERVKCGLEKTSEAEAKKMGLIESRLGEALAYVDTISRGLYPVELDTNGLMAALEEMALKISKAYQVVCKFKCRTNIFIHDGAVSNHVYRIAQEAIVNAIKGGKATKINIRLSRVGNEVTLTVVDNGIGLGNGPLRKGMGLKLMEYRSRIINGLLHIRSRPKGTTFIRCSFPIQPETTPAHEN